MKQIDPHVSKLIRLLSKCDPPVKQIDPSPEQIDPPLEQIDPHVEQIPPLERICSASRVQHEQFGGGKRSKFKYKISENLQIYMVNQAKIGILVR